MENVIEVPTIPGTPFGGGFYAGNICINSALYALIVAPKVFGERVDVQWDNSATNAGWGSCNHGLANTAAMATSGSTLAHSILGVDINGFTDWYLPS